MNIAVFAQGTDAEIEKAVYDNEINIPISRKAELSYPGYADLVGEASLIGDSRKVIGSGTYRIIFDEEIDLENVVILFEPALEMRMTVSINGREITDYSELDNVMEGDKISISSAIYEMGTDNIIDPSLMPPGTKFEITVSENGKTVEKSDGEEMLLQEYALKNIETEINAVLTIEGFNPIVCSRKFVPAKYEAKAVYEITPSFSSDIKSVNISNITANRDLNICFTVYKDGSALTDVNAVKALHPVIMVTPQGNDGTVTYTDDGIIVFTPNAAAEPVNASGSFDVEVACSIDDGTRAAATYTVLLADYQIVPIGTNEKIRKNEFYDNQVGVSFYITKDGIKLDKNAVEKQLSASLNEEYSDLKLNVSVASDGTIAIIPYSEEKHEVTFGNWWVNWAYYFGLEGTDLNVTVNHSLGSASSLINVIEADAGYLILDVYLPLLIEVILLAAIIAYIIRYFTKPRFASNAVLYVGSIQLNRGRAHTHSLDLYGFPLKKFNKFKNLWNPFKELNVSVSGINITAAKGNRIICNEPFPWYSDAIKPQSRTVMISSPQDIVDYCQEKDDLLIQEIRTVTVMDEQNRIIYMDDSVYYFVKAEIVYRNAGSSRREVIESAMVFCYTTI